MNEYQPTIHLKDNTTLTITKFPAINNDAPTLIIYPAFGVKANYYTKFAQQLAERGITTITADLRGHGFSSVRPNFKNNFGFLEMIADLKAVSDYLKQQNPTAKIYLLGHSLGGQTASLAVAKYLDLANGLIMIGAPNVYYKGWSGFHYYRRKMMVNLLPVFGQLISLFPKLKIGGYYITQKQTKEWGYTGKTGNYNVIDDELDYEKAMAKVKIPILAIDIEDDLMAPKAAIANLYQKFKGTISLATMTLKKAETSSKLSHINWPRTADKAMLKAVKEWIDDLQ